MRRFRMFLGPQAMGGMVSMWGRASLIKQIQRGTITLANGELTKTATITAVVPENTRLVYLGNDTVNTGGGGTGASDCCVRIDLTNATTITATRLSATDADIVSYEVIEYAPGVLRTVQRGTVTATAAISGTATLATTLQGTAKATLDVLGFNNNTPLDATQFMGRVDLTNTTTVTITRIGNTNNLTAGYQVCEFY